MMSETGREGRTRRRRSGKSPRDRQSTEQGLRQLPWKQASYNFSPMEVLSEDQVEAIHETSMRILEELGIELMSAVARQVFKDAGAEVDDASGLVRADRDLILTAVKNAPAKFTLTPRNPEKALQFGGRSMAFSLVGGPPNVHDCVNGRRAGNFADFQNFTRLAHHFNAIQIIGNQVVAPVDLPANNRHLDGYGANIELSDLVFHGSAIGRGRASDAVKMMAISRGVTLDEMRSNPGVTTIISVNSPRRFDEAMAEGLMAMSELGQAVAVTPFTLMGAMTPVTIASALAQQNAEALFGVALTQLVRPGAPVMYGAYTSNVDLRSGAPAFGTPENTKANIASGQLARRYDLPFRASPTNASNCADAQAIWETQMSLWGSMMGHANLHYHAAGWLEGGLTASFEKLVLDVEMIQHMMSFVEPIPFDDDDLDFDAIAGVPSGGHFFGEPHTMTRYETAFYQPLVSDWQNHENWQIAGGKDATARATEIWQQALKEYEQPALDPGIREELYAYVAKRKEEIGSGEP